MSTEKETLSPSGSLITVLYGLIIYHNCFRHQEYISWWYLALIPLLYFLLWIPIAVLVVVIREWNQRR